MRTRIGTILIAVVALVVGAAAGWFAAGARGKNKCENVEVCKYGNVETANDGARRFAAVGGESKVTEAELAALRDKVASLKKELNEVLAAKGKKTESVMLGRDGDDSQENSAEVSAEEAAEKCKTHGEMKRLYPNVWNQRRDKIVKSATRALGNYDKLRRFMAELDVSSMTEEERENHERIMEIFAKKYALVRDNLEKIDNDARTLEQDKEDNDEIIRLDKEGGKLMAAEHDALLRITAENLGRRLGWTEADTSEFAETLRAVREVTSRAKAK